MANWLDSIRNLSKSTAGFSWALSVFGASQAGKLLQSLSSGEPGGGAARSFDDTTRTIREQFGGLDRTVFDAGNTAQQTALDLGFQFLGPAAGSLPAFPGLSALPSLGRPASGEGAGKATGDDTGDSPGPFGTGPGRGPEESATLLPPTGDAAAFVPFGARSVGAEDVFGVYNVGKGVFDETTAYINLNLDMFDFSGRWVGVQTGVHVNTTPAEQQPSILVEVPPPPPLPIDQPPVPHLVKTEWTKGLFTFENGSLIGQGPAWTHMVPLKDGAFLFMVTTSQVITAGTGVYEGARGIKCGTGTTLVAPGLVQEGKFPAPGFEFSPRVLDTFRLVKHGYQNVPPAAEPRGRGGRR